MLTGSLGRRTTPIAIFPSSPSTLKWTVQTQPMSTTLHEALIETNEEYASFYEIMRTNPLRVKRFTPGTFVAYMEERQAEGAEPGQAEAAQALAAARGV